MWTKFARTKKGGSVGKRNVEIGPIRLGANQVHRSTTLSRASLYDLSTNLDDDDSFLLAGPSFIIASFYLTPFLHLIQFRSPPTSTYSTSTFLLLHSL
ncbi:hypothetical protein BYT27DRAFT_6559813 [Phlegmacium glaucopus]|nr:hypothetical protein BYT27DRAFT_6559813 [Phlegmacium glaucopus]